MGNVGVAQRRVKNDVICVGWNDNFVQFLRSSSHNIHVAAHMLYCRLCQREGSKRKDEKKMFKFVFVE